MTLILTVPFLSQSLNSNQGNFTAVLNNYDYFGWSVSGVGDLDNDGIPDIAVGAYLDDDGGSNRGAIYTLFLNSDGTVKNHQKISDTEVGPNQNNLKA